jgi:uncharacterized membrane protein HdeD (DUF308 family)
MEVVVMQHAAEVWLVDMRQAWSILLARAVFAVAFGLVALIWPTITLLILAWAFGIFAVIDGATQIVDGIRRQDRPRWWIGLLLGLLELAAGVLALIWPGISAVALAAVVGAWALVTGFMYGILLAVLALRLRTAAQATTEPFPAPASP